MSLQSPLLRFPALTPLARAAPVRSLIPARLGAQEEKAKNPRPAPEKKKTSKKRPKPSGGSGTQLNAVVAPKDKSNLSAASDLLGPVNTLCAEMCLVVVLVVLCAW